MAKADPNRNLVAAVAYLFFFITGGVILFVEKDDKFIRFHAWQAVFISVALFILNIFGSFLDRIPLVGSIGSIYSVVISAGALVVWIVSMIKAYQGQVFKWPIVGNWAERMTK